jgi:glycine cleavage system regulatory protein
MVKTMVLTVIGQDRTGLVEMLSGVVAKYGGNWLESRMSRLGGQFAGIVRISFPSEREAEMAGAVAQLLDKGLSVTSHGDISATSAEVPSQIKLLELVGQDRPGIISHISTALAQFNINVEDLQTECSSAAMSGETLFHAKAKLNIPLATDFTKVRSALEAIASDLIVDISLGEFKSASQS